MWCAVQATSLLGAKHVSYGVGDVGTEKDVNRLVDQALKELDGGVDVLVANAGVGRKGTIDQVTADEYRDTFRTNVKGVYLWLNKIVPVMKKQQSGQIIVMSSIMGTRTAPGSALYAASKHALEGMIGCVRKDLSGSGIKGLWFVI